MCRLFFHNPVFLKTDVVHLRGIKRAFMFTWVAHYYVTTNPASRERGNVRSIMAYIDDKTDVVEKGNVAC
jgi:hypothetical protein